MGLRKVFGVALAAAFGAALAGFPGCGGKDTPPTGPDPPPNPTDTIAPLAVTDLHIKVPTYESLALVWTAPGDDGAKGTASKYDLRYSEAPITAENWGTAVCVDTACVPHPKPGGSIETVVLGGLDSGTRYYFALKTADERENTSAVSNCATERTLEEAFPPSDVMDLTARAVSSDQFELTWTAPGDDYAKGTADRYEIRYSWYAIVDEDDWNSAFQVGSLPPPKPAGQIETATVTVARSNESFIFAVKTADELENWSGLSNLAPGLGFDDDLWLTPNIVHPGDLLYVAYRACPTGKTNLAIDEGWFTLCCGPAVTACLVDALCPEGTYWAVFDFCSGNPEECIPFDYYWVNLCWEWNERAKLPLRFEPSPP